MAYITEADLESYLGETFDTTSVPTSAEVTEIIARTQAKIDTFTRTSFEATTESAQILDSDGLQRFRMPRMPLISVSSFEIDVGGLGNTTDWEARTEGRQTEDFVVLKEEGILYFHRNVPRAGVQNCRATYVYGYSTVPKEVENLALLLCTQAIVRSRLADNVYSSQDSITVGPITISKAGSNTIKGLEEFNTQVNEAWKEVGVFRTTLH